MNLDLRRVTWIALTALVVGLIAGAALAKSESAALPSIIAVLEPIGTIWINAVRMTIIPLVISLLISAVASNESLSSLGRLGGTAVGFFIAMMTAVAVYTALVVPPLLSGLMIEPSAAATLRETAASGSQQVATTMRGMGGITQRIVELMPPNPFRAAADGAMLPLIVFAVIFGAALSRIGGEQREVVVRFFRAVSEAMLVIIRWIFFAAPVGVFALALVVGARLGYTAVTAVGYYTGVFAIVMTGIVIGVYVVAVTVGGIGLRRFATAVAPAQVIALGSRSSAAALPSMIDAARDTLHLPAQIVSFILPMAVAIFRISVPVSFILGALFLGKLYGISLSGTDIAILAALSILLSFSVPGVPSGSLFMMAPAFADVGIPVEGVAILIAIDVIPDLLKTTTIVTAHMASAVVVTRIAGPKPQPVVA